MSTASAAARAREAEAALQQQQQQQQQVPGAAGVVGANIPPVNNGDPPAQAAAAQAAAAEEQARIAANASRLRAMPLNDTPVDEDEDMAEAAAGPSSPKLDKRTLNANTPKLVFTVEEAERNDMTVAQLIDILADDVERIVLLADGKLPRDWVPITLWLEMAVDNLQLRGRLRAALSAEFGGYLPVNAWHWLRTWLKKHVTSAEELSALSAWIKLKEQGGIQTLSELLQVIADMQRLLPRDFDQLCILQALSLVPLRLRNMLLRKTLQDGKQEDWASWAEFEQVLAAHVSAFPGYGKHAGSGGQGGTPKTEYRAPPSRPLHARGSHSKTNRVPREAPT